MLEPMEALLDAGSDPGRVARIPGGVLTAFNTFSQSVKTIAGAAAETINLIGADGNALSVPNTAAGISNLAEADPGLSRIMNAIPLPDTITGTEERARYKATVIGLAYAQWRANEGSGSRQASNQDIIMALDSIGANSGDVSTIVATVAQNAAAGLRSIKDQVRQTHEIGSANGLNETYLNQHIFGGDIAELDDRFSQFEGRVNTLQEGIGEFRDARSSDVVETNPDNPNVQQIGGATITFN
jgi:hypothetical protein